MLTMLTAKSGAPRAARSAVGECVRMIGLRRTGFALALLSALGTWTGIAAAKDRPVVVELFTSQGCYSCPPAEAFLRDLSRQPDIVALEFHVDYWNELVYGSAGKWGDPFSKPEFTRRQQLYNEQIRKKSGVYTPQMVIDGRFETVGSRRGAVLSSVRQARKADGPRLNVLVSHGAANGLSVAVDGPAKTESSIWLVRFKRAETTRVPRGENHGKTLKSHNIVTRMMRIGDWRGMPVTLDVPNSRPAPDEDCVILVQNEKPGAILGVARCPMEGA
jgi:hypothetical protein